MLTLIAKLLRALNSETSPWALAMAVVLGMIMGLTPLWRVHNVIILLAALLFRINLTAFLLSFAVFSGLAYLFDPLFHDVGLAVLEAPSWQGIYQAIYQTAIGRLTQFYHTITMGSVICSLLFAPILAVVTYFIVVNYRRRIQAWFNKLRVVRAIQASRIWQIYTGLRG
ncbi:DUF2062 domain-containing protein [Idiomarina tyrosinivorans]|uniref:DUF2062 domain-containing protein n=1 Tax=Idiomarina tyrosinivorans TaxID=1445662 RepID=A0A432ZSE6_9GAMM|nr:DUF2062 domain-containing protein [Idiomarina tyrosinivorans]RUO80756.1 DUF2062 domain-containing protein [Idiomarina tyrosinivorans]